jgi:hypothetical protein
MNLLAISEVEDTRRGHAGARLRALVRQDDLNRGRRGAWLRVEVARPDEVRRPVGLHADQNSEVGLAR